METQKKKRGRPKKEIKKTSSLVTFRIENEMMDFLRTLENRNLWFKNLLLNNPEFKEFLISKREPTLF